MQFARVLVLFALERLVQASLEVGASHGGAVDTKPEASSVLMRRSHGKTSHVLRISPDGIAANADPEVQDGAISSHSHMRVVKGSTPADNAKQPVIANKVSDSLGIDGPVEPLTKSSLLAKDSEDATSQVAQKLMEFAGDVGKTLPNTIDQFVKAVKDHADKITAELHREHTDQETNLNNKFNGIFACDSALNTRLESIEGYAPSSPKNLATASRVALCECRENQAVAVVEAQGCADQLKCYQNVMNEAERQKQTYLINPSTGSPIACAEARGRTCDDAWQTGAGGYEDVQVLDWFTKQKVEWQKHWDSKYTDYSKLIKEHEAATKRYTSLKAGSGDVPVEKGCDYMEARKINLTSECSTLQNRATLDQCTYRAQKKDACDTYTQCRNDAEAAWSSCKTRQTADSAHRKEAWVGAKRMHCLGSSIEASSGSMDLHTSMSGCSNLTCDGECMEALDLEQCLSRSPPTRASCPLPGAPCATPGWNPICDVSGAHRPVYMVGDRSGSSSGGYVASDSSCDGNPVAVNLVEHTDECQTCEEENAPPQPAYGKAKPDGKESPTELSPQPEPKPAPSQGPGEKK